MLINKLHCCHLGYIERNSSLKNNNSVIISHTHVIPNPYDVNNTESTIKISPYDYKFSEALSDKQMQI